MALRIGLIGCGEMGAAVGAHLVQAGHEVSTVLEGRGSETRTRAAEAGLAELPDLPALVGRADVLLSVVPPSMAMGIASEVAALLGNTGRPALFVDANAISPELVLDIAARFLPGSFLDGGLVGAPPRDGVRPRLYLAGPAHERLAELDGIAFDIVGLGEEIGRASAFKMAYAAVTKGTNALLTNALLLAARHGLLDVYLEELSASQPELACRAQANIPRLPADSGRWVFEMEEIARSFAAVGLPSGFHEGAAELMRLLDASPFGTETRRTIDRSRTARGTIETIDGTRD